MTRVALLRCEKLPSFITWEIPNLDELFAEDDLLLRGFQAQGLQASPVVWSDPAIDWDRFELALIRSTWDYLDASQAFLRVLADIEASSCKLYNPLAVVRWNMDKRYLLELARQGAPVIPTWLASAAEPEALYRRFAEHHWPEVVLKPVLGLAASHIERIPLAELPKALAVLRTDQPHAEYLVQPFIETVTGEGEWSFIYFDHRLSHVLLKKPAPGDYRVQGIYGGTIRAAEPAQADLLQAASVLNRLPADHLYARLDFVRLDGELVLMEAELIEPIFSFALIPESVARLVQATRRRYESERSAPG